MRENSNKPSRKRQTRVAFKKASILSCSAKRAKKKIALSLKMESKSSSSSSSSKPKEEAQEKAKGNVLAAAFSAHSNKVSPRGEGKDDGKKSALDRIREENEANKKAKLAKEESSDESSEKIDWWVTPGITVKVMHQTLSGGKYYKKKGKIMKVHNKYTADVRMVDGGDLIRLEQEMLETVIPNIGKSVKILKGPYRGQVAAMEAVDMQNFCCSVKLADGGNILEGLMYDEICKWEEDK